MEVFLRWAIVLLLTGGVRSPLRHMEEGRPYYVVRHGRRLTIERVDSTLKLPAVRRFGRGDRVAATRSAGFHPGAHGVVVFQEPNPVGKVWVLRDGASSEVFYYPHELEDE